MDVEKQPLDIIILNRNIRLEDNAALYYGSLRQNYLVLYVFDETYWTSNGRSPRQARFLFDCLEELNQRLKNYNSCIYVFDGSYDALTVWIESYCSEAVIHLNHLTDTEHLAQQLKKFKAHHSKRRELKIYRDFGIQVGNVDRDTWSKDWRELMNSPLLPAPKASRVKNSCSLLRFSAFHPCILNKHQAYEIFQRGGSTQAANLLETFLAERCRDYQTSISSPKTAEYSCSRLSPHITYGSISLRSIYKKATSRVQISQNKKDLQSFIKRLYWHCHFIQKLETEPRIEYRSMHSMCDDLRPNVDSELIERWFVGETGFPFLDACMKFLRQSGWINFRMRAMIMSFASYNLWQPWQATSPLLAQLFVDYEPGIHICQAQMQSGVTGINLPRIYSVTKQSRDQDPNADWIKKILPELQSFAPSEIHRADLKGKYPAKIVDLEETGKIARDLIWSLRKDSEFKKIARSVYLLHGSRKTARRY